MYTIEYYKTKKDKTIIEEPQYSGVDFRNDYMLRKGHLYQSDLNDKCHNIKSLTVDMEDINYVIRDRSFKSLLALHGRIKLNNFDKKYDSLMILNNNIINKRYIYEIIKCKWMINADEELNTTDVAGMLIRLTELIEQRMDDNYSKADIEDEMALIKYYSDTIKNKYYNDNDRKVANSKILRLGNRFIIKKD